MKAKHFLKGKTKTTCPFISKLSSFKIEKMRGLTSRFYASQNIENPFFPATVYGLSPYYHHLAVLEITYWLPTNMTLLHNGMHIGGQLTCFWHKKGFTFETKKRLIPVTHCTIREYENIL